MGNIEPLTGPVCRNGSGAWIRTTVRGSKGLGPAARRPPKIDLSLESEQASMLSILSDSMVLAY